VCIEQANRGKHDVSYIVGLPAQAIWGLVGGAGAAVDDICCLAISVPATVVHGLGSYEWPSLHGVKKETRAYLLWRYPGEI